MFAHKYLTQLNANLVPKRIYAFVSLLELVVVSTDFYAISEIPLCILLYCHSAHEIA